MGACINHCCGLARCAKRLHNHSIVPGGAPDSTLLQDIVERDFQTASNDLCQTVLSTTTATNNYCDVPRTDVA